MIMCGCSDQVSTEEEEFLVVDDIIVRPADSIRVVGYNCDQVDCKISATAILLSAYGHTIHPLAISEDREAEELLVSYGEIQYMSSWEDIVDSLNHGVPVLFKAYHPELSLKYSKIMEEDFQNSHWVVLYDIDEELVYISDPMSGFITSEVAVMENIWEKCGKQAIVLVKQVKMRKRTIVPIIIAATLAGCTQHVEIPEEEFLPISDKLHAPSIEIYYQYPEYPAGCELASVCQVLRYYGYEVDIEDLLYTYLPVSSEEWIYSYYGDIYSGGFAFPHAITIAIQDYLIDKKSSLRVEDISGCSWEEYTSYLMREYPLITWYTIDYDTPRWSYRSMGGYRVWWDLHCITVYDIDDKYVYIADPIEGFTIQEIEHFKELWQECGSYAVAVYQ